jgi:ATP phosphoribosyltransferase
MSTGHSQLDENTLKSIKLIVDAKIQCHVNTTLMKSVHTLDVLQNMKKNLEQITGAPLKIFIDKVTSFKDDVFWSLTPISQNFTDTLAPIDYSIDGWTPEDLEGLQSLLD